MEAQDRIEFVTTMMPRCINTVLDGLDSESRNNLAREMMGKMMSIFKEELNTEAQ